MYVTVTSSHHRIYHSLQFEAPDLILVLYNKEEIENNLPSQVGKVNSDAGRERGNHHMGV